MSDPQRKALHAAYMALEIFETYTLDTPFVREIQVVMEKAQAASKALAEVYQAIRAVEPGTTTMS